MTASGRAAETDEGTTPTRSRGDVSDDVAAAAPVGPVGPVDDAPLIPERSTDDSDVGWGEREDSNDERLRQDVPPHW